MAGSFTERTRVALWRDVRWPSLVDVLRWRAAETPDRLAFAFLENGEAEVDRLTDAELDRRARSIAAWLQQRGLAGERVLLPYPFGLEFITAFMGCLYAGAIAVPMYPPHPHRTDERLLTIAKDARARAVLCMEESRARLQAFLADANVELLATDTLPDRSADWRAHAPRREEPAFLQYTSGSTGTPRGVIVGHGNILHNVWYIAQLSDGKGETVVVSWQPFFHDMGLIGSMLYPIYDAATTYLMAPAAFLQKPIRWLRAASRYRGTHVPGPNFGLELCVSGTTPMERAGLDLSCVRCLWNGAEPVRAATLQRFTDTFAPHGFDHRAHLPCYGLAETTLCVSAVPPEQAPAIRAFRAAALEQHRAEACPPDAPGATLLAGSGWIGGGFDVRIVDPDTAQPCAPDGIGEIWVAGPSVTQGYWERPEETTRTFGARLATGDAGPFLRTGDLGFLHEDELYVTGRLKDMIIIRGRNVYPHDLEAVVEACHPALAGDTAAAFGIEVDGQETLAVAVELKRTERRRANSDEIFASIRAAVGEHFELALHWIGLVAVNKIPKTSSGKIMRSACRQQQRAGELPLVAEWRQTPTAAPRDATAPATTWNVLLRDVSPAERSRRIVAYLRQELATRLNLSAPPDARQGFEKLGVDSMMAVELVKALETWLGEGIELPATLLFDQPNIDAVAQYLLTLQAGHTAPSEPEGAEPVVAVNEPVAVVGLACRFPGAPDREAFWRLLDEGRDAIREVPADRWDLAAYFDPDPQAYGRMYTRVGGFVDGYSGFDAPFFDISPREALSMDPQQRVVLEMAWTALEDAGIAPGSLEGAAVGVFLGVSTGDYRQALLDLDAARDESMLATGTATCGVAGRLSYTLGLRGPCLVIDTACSSSIVAIHQAMQSLRLGESDLALAGGVNLVLSPDVTVSFCRAGMLSPDGRCKTFDAAADGYSRGEGCGIVVLKRLRDAQRDGDRILAVLRGSAVNQDGRSSGLTAPSGPAQSAVITRALRVAGVAPAQVQYLEAHGTGTPLGDPIEVQAADAVYSRGRDRDQPLLIGSVKTNLGHLEAAAGVAGLIKVVLALRHRRVPASLHFHEPNPHIRWEQHAVRVAAQAQPWPDVPAGARRLAALSSFGFVGTNAHLIVEEAPETPPRAEETSTPARDHHLLTLSARTAPALDELLTTYAAWLGGQTELSPADLCASANTGRTPFEQRAAFVFTDMAQLKKQFAGRTAEKPPAGFIRGTAPRERRRIGFLFTGQGAQYAGMGRELYVAEPVFRAAIDRCAAAYAELGLAEGEATLLDILFALDGGPRLTETRYAQPAIYALQVALAAQWRAWGVEPAALLGHSLGEYAAAAISGAFTLEDGMKLLRKRAQLMQHLPPGGAMASVTAPAETVEAALAGDAEVSVSAFNGLNTVISGPAAKLDALLDRFDKDGVYGQRLPATAAFHSAAVEPMLTEFEAYAAGLSHGATSAGLISTLTGAAVAEGSCLGAAHWRDHARLPVRFAQGVQVLFEEAACDVVLEIGPKAELMWLAQMCWRPDHEVIWLSSLEERRHAHAHFLTTAGRLFAAGTRLDFAAMEQPWRAETRKVALPTYPFQHLPYWPEGLGRRGQARAGDALLEVVWQPVEAPLAPAATASRQQWLLLADARPEGAALAGLLTDAGQAVTLVRTEALGAVSREGIEAALQTALATTPVDQVVMMWSPPLPADADGGALNSAQQFGVKCALTMAQALIHQGRESKVWFVTQGAQPVRDDDPVDATHAPVWGFGRTLGVEHPDRLGAMIDLPPGTVSAGDLSELVRILMDPESPHQLALREGRRWRPQLQRVAPDRVTDLTTLEVAKTGAYLITGGTGALGQELADHLAERGAGMVVLASRRGTDAGLAALQAALATRGCRVEVVKADVSRAADVTRLLDGISRLAPELPLRGIIHAAGLLRGAPVLSMTPETLDAVLEAKVAGAWALHQATVARALPLDFFVLFSSAASLLGLRGHSNYSAANAYLDGLAHHRRRLGLPGVSINWGPWAKRGMATQIESAEWEAMGTRLMAPDAAMRALDRLGAGAIVEPFVQQMNLARWGELAASGLLPPVLLEFMEAILPAGSAPAASAAMTGGTVPAGDGPLVQRLRPLGADARRVAMQHALLEHVGAVLGMPPDGIDPDLGFFDSGMNSIMAVELSNRLQAQLGSVFMLRPAAIFNHPTVTGMTNHLVASIFGGEAVSAAGAAPEPTTPVADFANLSPAELEAAFDATLGRTPGTRTAAGGTPDVERLRDALAHIARLQGDVTRLQARATGAIAVIGMGCRVPGADSPAAFWQLLEEGRDAITEAPADRWDLSELYDPDPDATGKISTRYGGFLKDIDLFDADFFGISPREARSLDPQHRLLMEVAWQALENANLAPDQLRGTRGGVFVGITVSDYVQRIAAQGVGQIDAYAGTGNALSAAAGRLAFKFGWHGPALAIDTACSSSLVAIHEACAALRHGECDHALAGGVNIMLSPEVVATLSRAHMLSPDGRCKTFDASADGFGRSEGCGMLVLKRLEDAERDGNHVLAVIRGSAVNQDGGSSGLTVPNGLAQEQLMRQALAMADLAPAQLQYLECHGTGTSLGDPIEVQAADAIYRQGRPGDAPLLIGSAKSNIGHMESAAGVGGVIKVVLTLQQPVIPPSLHFKVPNPHIPWAALNVRVVTEPTPWPTSGRRLAAVSSFGFVGTNAHVILEAAPTCPARQSEATALPPERGVHVLALSAQSAPALRVLAAAYRDWLTPETESRLADLCHTANTARSHLDHRAGLVFTDAAELRAQLGALAGGESTAGLFTGAPARGGNRRRVGFLFTGQGSQYTGMGRALYASEPVFREQMDRCAGAFESLRDGTRPHPLLAVMGIAGDTAAVPEGLLNQTGYTQPALYALSVALGALWRHWGVTPDVVLGHSVGEYAAAALAGVFSVEDGLRLIAERARLMQALPAGGAMVSVEGPAAQIEEALVGVTGVGIGAYNGASQVLSGEQAEVTAVVARLTSKGLRCKPLLTSHAFHSARMDPILAPFAQAAAVVTYHPATLRLISNVSGDVVEEGRVLDAAYWADHIRQPVRFADGVQTLRRLGCTLVLEVGPHPVLVAMGRRVWETSEAGGAAPRDVAWVGSLRRDRDDVREMLEATAQVYAAGPRVDFAALDAPWRARRDAVSLPHYPFQRQRYWIEERTTALRAPDCLYQVAWEPRDATPRATARASWLILEEAGGLGAALALALEARGQTCRRAPASEALSALSAAWATAGEAITRVVYLGALDHDEAESLDALRQAQAAGVMAATALLRTLVAHGGGERLWLITRGTQAARPTDIVAPAQSSLWGLGAVIALEQAAHWGGLIDLPTGATAAAAGALADALLANDGEDRVALREGRRWVARLARLPVADAPAVLTLRENSTYLVTGGLGGIGLHLARRLAARGARHLALVGRQAPGAAAREAIAALEAEGCTVRVLQADLTREADVTTLIETLRNAPMPLAGLVHAAGVAGIAPLIALDDATLEAALAAKVYGGWLLDRLTMELEQPLSLFVLTASATGVWGSLGQGAYAAANAFLDALAQRRAQRGLPACAIDFGPWHEVGMMAAASDSVVAWMRAHGITPMTPAFALDGLETMVALLLPRALFVSANWATMSKALRDSGQYSPLLEHLAPSRLLADDADGDVSAGAGAARPDTEFLGALRRAEPGERDAMLRLAMREDLARILRRPAADLRDDIGFFDLGMDSLMAVEFRDAMGARLGRRLPATVVMDHPDVSALSTHVLATVLNLTPAAPPPGGDVEEKPDAAIAALSSEQVAAALDDELSQILGPP